MDDRSQHPRLLPVDEAMSKPDFFEYRARLQVAVEHRDVDVLIEASDPGIRLGVDASDGTDALPSGGGSSLATDGRDTCGRPPSAAGSTIVRCSI